MSDVDLRLHRLADFVDRLPPLGPLEGDVRLTPDDSRFAPNFVTVEPRSLDDLKAWIGVPADRIDHDANPVVTRPVDEANLPGGFRDLDSLTAPQRQAVDAAAQALLFGDGGLEKDPRYQRVAQQLLEDNRELPVLVGDDLTVEDGQTVTFTTPTCCFNSITIHGTGTIQLECDCKVITDSLTYVPS